MAESQVTVFENPVTVTISDNTPIVTVTDNTPTVTVTEDGTHVTIQATDRIVSVIDASPVVNVIAGAPPTVIVNTGIGSSYDKDNILSMLEDQLTIDYMTGDLLTDLTELAELWARIPNSTLILQVEDGEEISRTMRVYTDDEISDTMFVVNNNSGLISTHYSFFSQEVDRIDFGVGVIENDLSDTDIVVAGHGTRITLTENDITSHAIDIASHDGLISGHTSSIQQNASQISSDVARIDADIVTDRSNITQNADDIQLYVTQLNSNTGRINSAEFTIDAHSATLTILETETDGTTVRLQAVEQMLVDRWGVTITEDPNGVPYTTGIGVILHPDWESGYNYEIEVIGTGTASTPEFPADHVYSYNAGVGNVYKCILAHTSSTANNPASPAWATYWELVADGEKTEFRVKADQFSLWASANNPSEPLFTVNVDAVTLGYGVALRSSDYGDNDKTWYQLDASSGGTGATFHNMAMTFGGTGNTKTDAQTALNVADGATQGATWGTDLSGVSGSSFSDELNTVHTVEDGANITGTHTSADTTLVNGVAAATVEGNAANAAAATAAMESDLVFSIPEKEQWQIQWPGMSDNYDAIIAEATAYGIQAEGVFTTLDSRYTTLYNFLNTTHSVFVTSPVASAIAAGAIQTPTNNFYESMGLAQKRLTEYSTQFALEDSVTLTQGGIILQGSANIQMSTGGALYSASKTTYASTTAGYWLGYDTVGGANKYRFVIGDGTTYMKWDGASLAIKGDITVTNTGDFAPSDADKTNAILQTGTQITSGGITLSAGGALKSFGKDDYNDTTDGFWLGYTTAGSLNKYTFAVGNATENITWDGTNLSITGDIIVSGNIVDGSVSDSDGANASGGQTNSTTGITLCTVSVTTTDAAEDIYVHAAVRMTSENNSGGSIAYASLVEGASTVRWSSSVASDGNDPRTGQLTDIYIRTSTAANTTYTFYLKVASAAALDYVDYAYPGLAAILLKK